jgi:hypothetical protein
MQQNLRNQENILATKWLPLWDFATTVTSVEQETEFKQATFFMISQINIQTNHLTGIS